MTVFVFSVIRSGCLPSVGVSACATPTDARRAAPRTAPVKFLVSLDFRNPKICFGCMLFLSIANYAPIGCDSNVLGLMHQNVPTIIISQVYRECKQMTESNGAKKKEPKGSFYCHYFNPQPLRMERNMNVVVVVGRNATTVRHQPPLTGPAVVRIEWRPETLLPNDVGHV